MNDIHPDRDPHHNDSATRWSEVEDARHSNPEIARRALSSLLDKYLPMLRRFLRGYFHLSEDDCDEVLQEFTVRKILEGELFRKADRQKGRFRSFLQVALKNYYFDWLKSKKRRPEHQVLNEPQVDPAPIFDAEWARAVITNSLKAMREECKRKSQTVIWNIFFHRIIAPLVYDDADRSFEQLADDHNLPSAAASRNRLETGKRQFRKHLKRMVLDTIYDEGDFDDELRELWRAVKACGQVWLEQGLEEHPSVLKSGLNDSSAWEPEPWEALGFDDSARLHDLVTPSEISDLRPAFADELERSLGELIEEDKLNDLRIQEDVSPADASRSIRDVLTSSASKESLIFGKLYYRNRTKSAAKQSGVAPMLYHLFIVAAWLEHDELITKLASGEIMEAWDRLAARPWLETELRQRLLDGNAKLAQL